MVSNDLRVIKKDIVKWSDEVIGEGRRVENTLWKLVMEEIPELATEYNKTGLISPSEIADVLILVLDLCHLNNIDPAEAIAIKMHINRNRKWTRSIIGVTSHVDT